MTAAAPLGRLIITDTASQSRRHVEWGLEGPLTYNSATSLLIDSDDMVTSGFAGAQSAAVAGAYDPNASGSSTIAGGAYLQTAALCGTGNQSHVGSFRVRARVMSALGNSAMFRLSWQAGDAPFSTNQWAIPRTTFNWEEHDLGTITIPVGSGRWTGRVEVALNPANLGPLGTGVFIDYLTLVPVSDGYGKARATFTYSAGVITGYDQFTSTTAGAALNARVAPAGGTWATSGSSTDFAFADEFHSAGDGIESVIRSTIAVETTGRFGILGTANYTDTQVEARFNGGGISDDGLVVRWIDANNYLRLRVPFTSLAFPTIATTIYVEQVVAGAVTQVAQAQFTRNISAIYRFRLLAFASGHVIGQVLTDQGTIAASAEGSSTQLATGGTLASGKPGIWDRALSASFVQNRLFTAISVSTPPAEPIALYSGRNIEFRHDKVSRQDATGTYAGRPPSDRSARFLVPVGTSRVLVKARRNDIETAADDQVTDSLQIQIAYTPRGLAVPR